MKNKNENNFELSINKGVLYKKIENNNKNITTKKISSDILKENELRKQYSYINIQMNNNIQMEK